MNPIKNYKLLNNLTGWVVFLIAAAVYLMTIEPTASWWDCGEYISTAFKLEVGHPPGAPLFQIMARFFTLFAGGDVTRVAVMVNSMSAILSAFGILFLFWTITAIAKKIFVPSNSYELTAHQAYITLAAGLVGSLAYTFCDSYWFSAVEGEVYATSAFFTSIVFWAMLKWEVVAHEKHANRWIIFIAFMMGLSIGVHLLNLLCIPAMTLIYYFRKGKQSKGRFVLALLLGIVILGFVQSGIIPLTVKMAGYMELFFVNSVGMPFNSGTLIYFILIIGAVVFGLWITKKKGKSVINTAIWAFTFILIGYSSFIMLVVRANANPPINENAPKDALTLLTYLNRDQYGDWPILYGRYYNARLIDIKDGGNNYIKGKDKYIVTNTKPRYVYEPEKCGLLPRMWSDQPKHVAAYKAWTGIKSNRNPTLGENLEFLFKNQLGNQYFRYFMWNFAGRQNDIQGFGIDDKGNKDVLNGNWISGIKFIDEARLGNQDKLPDYYKNNKGRNKFYMLPLLLGLIGLVYHFTRKKKDAVVVTLLFLMTGVAIIFYLNPTPLQPRERDYAYAGSFYAFAIWIGLGVIAIYELLSKKMPKSASIGIATLISLLAVPYVMAKEGWDDHDRSHKYACRDFAKNYLASCAPNAILITNGDNDTFPLWYVQEVEGFRTDVRVVNFTLSSGDWYIHQLFNKMYDSDPLPFTISSDKYTAGSNDIVPYKDMDGNNVWDLKKIINFINSDDKSTKAVANDNEIVPFLPTKNLSLRVDSLKVCNNGTVPRYLADKVVKAITWKVQKSMLQKNDLMLLDLLATNNWERPIYFASPSSVSDFLDISDYCYLEGGVYRFIPVKSTNEEGVLVDESYKIMMNDFLGGNLNDPRVYVDKESYYMAAAIRSGYARLANALIQKGEKDKAKKVLDKALEMFPDKVAVYDRFMLYYGMQYFMLKENKKAIEIFELIGKKYEQDLDYYYSVEGKKANVFKNDIQEAVGVIYNLREISSTYGEKEQAKKYNDILVRFGQNIPTQGQGQ